MSEEFVFELKDPTLKVSNEVLEATTKLIHDSHLLRTVLIVTENNREKAAKSIMNIIDKFFEYITKKEESKVLVNVKLIEKYEYYIHLLNLQKAYEIYLFIPEKKDLNKENAKAVNTFIHYLNTSQYVKKLNKESKGSESYITHASNKLATEFFNLYEETKKKDSSIDMNELCKQFFDDKMKVEK